MRPSLRFSMFDRLRQADWILPICALQTLAACGGRTEIGVDARAHDAGLTQDVIAESGPLAPCHAGDPPRTLVTGIQTVQFNGMAADADHLYVAQSIAPLLWSIPMLGGDTVALYGADFPNSVSTSTPTPLLTADGGIYFDALGDEGDGLTWVSGAGGKPKTIAPNYVSFFDWTQPRAFVWSGDIESGAFLTLALDGALQPFLTIPPFHDPVEIVAVLATRRFLHVALIDVSSQPYAYSDRRFDLDTGTMHDEVPLDAGNSQIFMGPTAICVISSNADGISCLQDDQSVVSHIPTSSGPFPRYIDTQWVYAAVAHDGKTSDFSRYSLVDGHDEVLMAGAYPAAVTSFGDCVYAALVTQFAKPAADIWRISPPH